jgi:addiction module RelE/StbE family toxin
MMTLYYKPSFVRQLKSLETELIDEAFEKIELFKNEKNHRSLKVHKLHGRLAGRWSFSVNYKYRIVFIYQSKTEVVVLTIGDHTIYS